VVQRQRCQLLLVLAPLLVLTPLLPLLWVSRPPLEVGTRSTPH
jgi:hypothetical protein